MVTIKIKVDGIERKLDCEYYTEAPDPSVGYGGCFTVEEVSWYGDPDTEVPDSVFPDRQEEIDELAEEALWDERDSYLEGRAEAAHDRSWGR